MKFVSIVLMLSAALWAQDGASTFQKAVSGSWKQVDSNLLKVEPEVGRVKISYFCKQDGSCEGSITGNYDGKPYKDTGLSTATRSFRKTGDRTMQENDYLSSKLSRAIGWQL